MARWNQHPKPHLIFGMHCSCKCLFLLLQEFATEESQKYKVCVRLAVVTLCFSLSPGFRKVPVYTENYQHHCPRPAVQMSSMTCFLPLRSVICKTWHG